MKLDADTIFLFFAGLLAAYSLQRLLPMKLYDWEKFTWSPLNWSVIKRYLVGCFANIVVAMEFAVSWAWLKYLCIPENPSSFIQVICTTSLAISSASIVLASHRIIASVVIFYKNSLFTEAEFGTNFGGGDFEKFLNSKPLPHLTGAIYFLGSQIAFGILVRAVLEKVS